MFTLQPMDPSGVGHKKGVMGLKAWAPWRREESLVTHRLSWLAILSLVTLRTILALQG